MYTSNNLKTSQAKTNRTEQKQVDPQLQLDFNPPQ